MQLSINNHLYSKIAKSECESATEVQHKKDLTLKRSFKNLHQSKWLIILITLTVFDIERKQQWQKKTYQSSHLQIHSAKALPVLI